MDCVLLENELGGKRGLSGIAFFCFSSGSTELQIFGNIFKHTHTHTYIYHYNTTPHPIKVFLSGSNSSPVLLYRSVPLTGKAGKEIWCMQAEFSMVSCRDRRSGLFVCFCLWRWCQPGASLLTLELWCRSESSCAHALMQMSHLHHVVFCNDSHFICVCECILYV